MKKLGAGSRQTIFKRSKWAVKNMRCCLLSEATIANRRVTVGGAMLLSTGSHIVVQLTREFTFIPVFPDVVGL
jgi:hypothetical protein